MRGSSMKSCPECLRVPNCRAISRCWMHGFCRAFAGASALILGSAARFRRSWLSYRCQDGVCTACCTPSPKRLLLRMLPSQASIPCVRLVSAKYGLEPLLLRLVLTSTSRTSSPSCSHLLSPSSLAVLRCALRASSLAQWLHRARLETRPSTLSPTSHYRSLISCSISPPSHCLIVPSRHRP
eukprot:1711516-Pleurochrysis_carterae.AAC.1